MIPVELSLTKDGALPKRAAAINDLTGFGRCSLAVVLPILNAMGVQACPVPTSVFSNHMMFPTYSYRDLSDFLPDYLEAYDRLELFFDGIYCGFLNSPKQFHPIRRFLEKQRSAGCKNILIDPVLGDKGRTYHIVTDELCLEMKRLVHLATILTPNLTEACILTGVPFPKTRVETGFLEELSHRLLKMGTDRVVITGIPHDTCIMNYCVEKTGNAIHTFSYESSSNGESRPGTGDIFASILTADMLNQAPFDVSVKKAADFIRTCVNASADAAIPIREGVLFEPYLSMLNYRQEEYHDSI